MGAERWEKGEEQRKKKGTTEKHNHAHTEASEAGAPLGLPVTGSVSRRAQAEVLTKPGDSKYTIETSYSHYVICT